MALVAPPTSPPRVALDDDDRFRRLHVRLRLFLLTTLTILITAWFCTFGWIPAIIAVMIGKHVLVAILVMGLGVDAARRAQA